MLEVIDSSYDTATIKWKKPDSNNSKIQKYNIYLSQKTINNIGTHKIKNESNSDIQNLHYKDSTEACLYTFTDLNPNSAYFAVVTAVNEHGEGYKSKTP